MKRPVGGSPAGEGRGTEIPSPAGGHVPCVVCLHVIRIEEYRTARCWVDPDGISCAAHAPCLIRLGEPEVGLR